MSSEVVPWVWDDASIPDGTPLLRRVSRKPSVLIQDPATLSFQLKPEAFTYDRGSGLSILIEEGAATYSAIPWATHGCAIFSVSIVRGEASGTVRDPMPDEIAHGLVRVAADPDGNAERRRQWLPLRSRIRDSADYCDDAVTVAEVLQKANEVGS